MAVSTIIFVGVIILIALAFDFTNGIHDAANSVATIVSTRTLTPRQAVLWAAFFNFVAFLIFGTGVAKTIGSGMVDIKNVTPLVILAGLTGAILWNLFTWYLGLPTSSSHALIGGYAGAAVAKSGFGVIILGGWYKTILFIALAPIIGLILGVVLMIIVSWIVHRRSVNTVNYWSRRMQIVSAALYSLGHGSNDAQKTVGIITGLLLSAGFISSFQIPLWVILAAYSSIALGTMMGGWRIVRTMGQKITRLKPLDGFCAETASAGSIFLATFLGVPVSTTHVITGAVSGVGAARRFSGVRWGVTLRIVWAWLFTIPVAAFVGAIVYLVLNEL
jgi:inorganic phosphate transporter, PiT family